MIGLPPDKVYKISTSNINNIDCTNGMELLGYILSKKLYSMSEWKRQIIWVTFINILKP